MANNRIVLKKSSVTARVPVAADLAYGELALNYTDGYLYYKDSSNNIKKFSDSTTFLGASDVDFSDTTNSTFTTAPVIFSGGILVQKDIHTNGNINLADDQILTVGEGNSTSGAYASLTNTGSTKNTPELRLSSSFAKIISFDQPATTNTISLGPTNQTGYTATIASGVFTAGSAGVFYDAAATTQGTASNVVLSTGGTGSGTTGGFLNPTGASGHFRFQGTGSVRTLTTRSIDLRDYGALQFKFIAGNGQNGGETPDTTDDFVISYSNDGGSTYTELSRILGSLSSSYNSWTTISIDLLPALTNSTGNDVIKWQNFYTTSGEFDHYGLAEVEFSEAPNTLSIVSSTNDVTILQLREDLVQISRPLTLSNGFQSINSSQPSTIKGALTVDGTTSLNGTVNLGNTSTDQIEVNGDLDVNSTSTFTSTATFNGTLNANGTVNLGNSSADLVDINGNLDVNNIAEFYNNVYFYDDVVLGNSTSVDTTTFNSSTVFNGSNLFVGTGTFSGNLVANNNTTLGVNSGDILTVNSTATFNSAVTADITGTVSDISNHDTDALSEGATNLYYTDARVQAVSINEVVEDTTPTLGGNLVTAGNDILMTDDDYIQWNSSGTAGAGTFIQGNGLTSKFIKFNIQSSSSSSAERFRISETGPIVSGGNDLRFNIWNTAQNGYNPIIFEPPAADSISAASTINIPTGPGTLALLETDQEFTASEIIINNLAVGTSTVLSTTEIDLKSNSNQKIVSHTGYQSGSDILFGILGSNVSDIALKFNKSTGGESGYLFGSDTTAPLSYNSSTGIKIPVTTTFTGTNPHINLNHDTLGEMRVGFDASGTFEIAVDANNDDASSALRLEVDGDTFQYLSATSGVTLFQKPIQLSSTASSIIFEGATTDSFETTLTVADPTADRTITLPDSTGYLVTASGAVNTDAEMAMGNAKIGFATTGVNAVTFAYKDYFSIFEGAISQNSNGYTWLNAPTGAEVSLRINNDTKANVTNTDLELSAGIGLFFKNTSGADIRLVSATTTGVDKTITLPDASGTVAVSVSDTTTTTQGDLNVDFTLSAAGDISATGDAHGLSTTDSPTFDGLTITNDLILSGDRHSIGIVSGSNLKAGGTTNRWDAAFANNVLHFHNNSTGNVGAGIKFTRSNTGSTDSDGIDIGINNLDNFIINNNEAAGIALSTNNAERLFIASDGSVEIQGDTTFNDTTTSTSTTTGAVKVGGGVGIAENLNVGGTTTLGGNITSTGTHMYVPATFTIDPATHGDATGTVVIAGDLTVQGNTVTVSSNEVNIGDAVLVLNSDETGTPSQDSGIEIERGTSTNVSLLWDEGADKWTVGTGTFVAGTFEGNLTGNVTGTITGGASLNVLKAGDTMTGNLHFGDGIKATFGDATTPDFSIYHNASGMFLEDTGVGNIIIRGSGVYLQNTTGQAVVASTVNNTARLSYHGSGVTGTKLETSSDGITVTGKVTGDLVGDVYASNGTSKVLEAGTDGTDATFTGDITGNVTGDVTGTVSDISNHDTDALSEGTTNLYYTSARANADFDTKLAAADTDDLSEGTTNLYYTDARADARIAAASVDDLSDVDTSTTAATTGDALVWDGTNWAPQAPFSQSDFDTAFTAKDTDDLSEGTTNLYYTDARADARIAAADTDDLSEGTTNLYYTDARWDTKLAAADTDDLSEGTNNLYYTSARANSAIDARVTTAFVDALNVDADTLDGIDSTGFATAAQGTKADSAYQPSDNVVFYNGHALETYVVTVASKTTDHPNQNGSTSAYFFGGNEAPFIHLQPNRSYRFDQSDSSNNGHPLKFYTSEDKVGGQYTTGVTTNGTPGSAGAYTEISVDFDTPQILFYQCELHSFMGGGSFVPTESFTGKDTDDLPEGSSNLYFTNSRAQSAITKTVVDALNVDAATLNGQNPSYYLDYTNLTNIPQGTNISDVSDLTDNFNLLFSGSYADLTNKPTSFDNLTSLGMVTGVDVDEFSNDVQLGTTTPSQTALITEYAVKTYLDTNMPTVLTDLGITDGSSGQVLVTDGAGNFSFAAVSSSGGGLANVIEDTTPQLGGSLDVNGQTITSASNGDVTITPNGTGNLVLNGLNFPTTDGSSGQVIRTDGAGNLTFGTVSGGGGAGDLIPKHNIEVYEGDGTTTVFTLNNSVTNENELWIEVGGVTQTPGASYSYTASGTTLTFNEAPNEEDRIVVRYLIYTFA